VSVDPAEGEELRGREPGSGDWRSVDARGSAGVQVGDGNVQINYSYRGTSTDGVAPPPLVDVSGVVDSPYRGLRAFDERDAAFFFGRETAATQVLERMSRILRKPGLLVVSGVSGAGKSSLLRAGVLPRLRGAGLASAPGSETWPCVVFTPTGAPLDELSVRVAPLAGSDAGSVRETLRGDPARFALIARQATLSGQAEPDRPKRLLVVVDQFEQLFSRCRSEDERRAFITALHAAGTVPQGDAQIPAAVVVLVVRADFEARIADYPELVEAVQDRYLVTSMTERQLRLAITEPAKRVGSGVDDDLVDLLLVAGRSPAAAGLPLLSHALDQAWRSRVGARLTLADYERTGGIEGAVEKSAQRAYDSLDSMQQAITQQIFIRLTATSADGVDTADRVAYADLVQGRTAEDVTAVLEAFAAERLLTLAAGTVQISHEVLFTAWPLLRDFWLIETHADRIARTRLRTVTAEWIKAKHDPSYLYSGTLLESVTESAARIGADPARHPSFSQAEQDFLKASQGAHRLSVYRRRGFTAFLMVLVLGLATVAFVAYRASGVAQEQQQVATARQLVAKAEAALDSDPRTALMLNVAAHRLHPDAETYSSLQKAITTTPYAGQLTGVNDQVSSVAYSTSGRYLAAGFVSGAIMLWDLHDPLRPHQVGEPFTLQGFAGPVTVGFSSGDSRLVTASPSGALTIWDLTNPEHPRPMGTPVAGEQYREGGAWLSPDGTVLATSSKKNRGLQLWDLTEPAQIRPLGPPLAVYPHASLRPRLLHGRHHDRHVRRKHPAGPRDALGHPATAGTAAARPSRPQTI
jgi:hypothetical protein